MHFVFGGLRNMRYSKHQCVGGPFIVIIAIQAKAKRSAVVQA